MEFKCSHSKKDNAERVQRSALLGKEKIKMKKEVVNLNDGHISV